MKNKLVIVHHNGDCDGLMGGTLATVKHAKALQNAEALIFGYDYEKEHEWMESVNALLEDTEVRMEFIDITPYTPWLENVRPYLEDGLLKITIYDHHAMKYDDINKLTLPNITYVFNNDYCGSWIYYHAWLEECGGNLMNITGMNPVFASLAGHYVDMVDAWDTWKFVSMNEKESRDVLAFNETFGTNKNVHDFYTMMMNTSYKFVLSRGYCIIDYIVRQTVPRMFKTAMITETSIEGLEEHTRLPVLLVNGSPSFYAEQFLNATFKDKRFIVLYYTLDFINGKVKLSLRNTVKGIFDCSKIARSFDPNGGGHADAAGCTMTLSEFMPLVVSATTDSLQLENKKLLEELPVKGFDTSIVKTLMIEA